MEEIIEKVVESMCARYSLFKEEAYSIVYSEWEYIESAYEECENEKKFCERVAKDILEMYMVA